MRIHFHYHWQVPKKERYFNLFIGVWNLFLFIRGLPFCTSNGKGSLTQLTLAQNEENSRINHFGKTEKSLERGSNRQSRAKGID